MACMSMKRIRAMKRPIGNQDKGRGRIGTLLVGLGAGAFAALAAFLADPSRGRARRARLLDQGSAGVRRAGREVERVMRRVGSMASGKLEAVTEGGSRARPTGG